MSLLVLAELDFVVFGVGGDIRTLVPSKFEAEDDRNAILIFFLSLLLLLSGSGQQATAASDISNLISSSIIFISLASCFLPYFAVILRCCVFKMNNQAASTSTSTCAITLACDLL